MQIPFPLHFEENTETNRKTNGNICDFLFHVVACGCDANNEVDSLQQNLAHLARFGDRIIFDELFHVAQKQERFPFDLPAKWIR